MVHGLLSWRSQVDPAGQLAPSPNWIGHRPSKSASSGFESRGGRRKLTAENVAAIRELRAAGHLSEDIAARFGVSQSLVCQICTGRLWLSAAGPLTRKNADPGLPRETRFWALVDKRSPGECWPWLGGRTPDGYGRLHVDGDEQLANRIALSIRLERELLPTEVARHTCDNPPCCNPDHLIPGSTADNNRDCNERGRRPVKISAEQVIEIRAEAVGMGWGRNAALAKRYGITPQQIGRIIAGRQRSVLPVVASPAGGTS